MTTRSEPQQSSADGLRTRLDGEMRDHGHVAGELDDLAAEFEAIEAQERRDAEHELAERGTR